jgi:hypothetical protein
MAMITSAHVGSPRALPFVMAGFRYGATPHVSVQEDDGSERKPHIIEALGRTEDEAVAEAEKTLREWVGTFERQNRK